MIYSDRSLRRLEKVLEENSKDMTDSHAHSKNLLAHFDKKQQPATQGNSLKVSSKIPQTQLSRSKSKDDVRRPSILTGGCWDGERPLEVRATALNGSGSRSRSSSRGNVKR